MDRCTSEGPYSDLPLRVPANVHAADFLKSISSNIIFFRSFFQELVKRYVFFKSIYLLLDGKCKERHISVENCCRCFDQ